MSTRIRSFSIAPLALSALCASANAQVTTANICGTVTDSTGAVIASRVRFVATLDDPVLEVGTLGETVEVPRGLKNFDLGLFHFASSASARV